jgi:drug/metabolite transporter (DMT)-like permease
MLSFAALISGSFSLGGQAARYIDPSAINAVRFIIAVLIMAVFVHRTAGWRRAHVAAPWRYLVMGGLLGAYFVLMFYALQITDPVSTGAVFTLTPLMAAGFGWLFQRQVSRPTVLLALAVGAAGAIWVIFRGDVGAMLAFDVGLGERLYLVGCACHAAYTPLVPRFNRGEPLIVFTFWTLVAGCLLISLFGWQAIIATDWLALPAIVWITIAYISVFATAVTFFLLQYAAMRLPAGKVMAYGYLVPSFVILWEGLSGRGWVSGQVWLGVAATIAALVILLREEGGRPVPARVAGE